MPNTVGAFEMVLLHEIGLDRRQGEGGTRVVMVVSTTRMSNVKTDRWCTKMNDRFEGLYRRLTDPPRHTKHHLPITLHQRKDLWHDRHFTYTRLVTSQSFDMHTSRVSRAATCMDQEEPRGGSSQQQDSRCRVLMQQHVFSGTRSKLDH